MTPEQLWYAELIKPTWAPPDWIFGPVWTVLYAIILVSFGFVVYRAWRKDISWRAFLPFGSNLVFNALFSPIQFGLRNNFLAMLDIVLVLVTLIWALRVIYPHYRWVSLVNIPYLLWVSFATILQVSITWLNR